LWDPRAEAVLITSLRNLEHRLVEGLPEDRQHLGRAAVRFSAGLVPWGLLFALIFAVLDQPGLAACLTLAAVGVGTGPLVMRATGSLPATAHWMNVALAQSLLYPAWLLGGLFAACIPWLSCCVAFATFLAGRAAGVAWAAISVGLMAVGFWLQVEGHVPDPVVGIEAHLFLAAMAHAGLFVLVVAVSWAVASSNERHAAELSAALQTADDASKAKSAFLASMSHELRTPMNAIIGYAELLLEDADEQDAHDLGRIRDAGTHLLHLLNDVLDLSKVEAGRMAFVDERIDLTRLAREVVEASQVLADAGGNTLHLQASDDVWVHGDGMRLKQVLMNLVSNAAKFTESGRIVVRVVEGAVEVEDSGQGMSAEEAARVFEPFVQARDDLDRTHGGTGLGLALVREFVQRMGGAVSVRSQVGQGSTFRVRLRSA
jgi:signal transduction histidine kinase